MVAEAKTAEKQEKAASISYDSKAMTKPRAVDHLPSIIRTGGGGGGRTATDIKEAFDQIVLDRKQWFLVAEGVGNPGRFYDGFRGHGATVKVNKTGKGKAMKAGKEVEVDVYDVYAMVPEGPIQPWKKASAKKKVKTADADGSGDGVPEKLPAGSHTRRG